MTDAVLLLNSPFFVIPAKAGIYLLTVNFWLHCLHKPQGPVMDSRLRGNDERGLDV